MAKRDAHVFRLGDRVKRLVPWPDELVIGPSVGDRGTVTRVDGGFDIRVLFDNLPGRGPFGCYRSSVRYIGMRVNPLKVRDRNG